MITRVKHVQSRSSDGARLRTVSSSRMFSVVLSPSACEDGGSPGGLGHHLEIDGGGNGFRGIPGRHRGDLMVVAPGEEKEKKRNPKLEKLTKDMKVKKASSNRLSLKHLNLKNNK